jgi:hypothetical protein
MALCPRKFYLLLTALRSVILNFQTVLGKIIDVEMLDHTVCHKLKEMSFRRS